MKLRALLDGLVDGDLPDLDVAEVRDDSRKVGPGDLFVAVRGQTVDGHAYLKAAAERGAGAALVETRAPAEVFPGVQVQVPSTQRALGLVAANRFGRPADAMTMVGVTGTNGKTTTTFLAEGLVRAAGGRPGVIGTVAYRFGDVTREAPYTTPTPLELHATLAEMRVAGCTHVTMECSSHALALDRLEGVQFDVGAFTNLTQDHLDFHGTMAAYRDAKARLFSERLRPSGVGVVLIDREHGEVVARAVRGRALRVSARSTGADVCVTRVAYAISGIEAEVATPAGPVALRSPLIGAFNLENLVVGVGIGLGLGLDPAQIAAGLGQVRGAPGRLERVQAAEAHGFSIFVDYAHTPDALERAMAALRPLVRGRLLVVFGCGGDRDRTKRPKMGAAVARDAEVAFVTSDNPRTEDPQAIVDMIVAGMDGGRAERVVEVDRRRAIGLAVAAAKPGDVVLIAGKGHEDYQIIGKTKHPFDDRQEATIAVQKMANAVGNGQI